MQTLLFVAQEIDLSKWSSAIVSALVGFAVIVAMRTQIGELLRRLDKTDAKVDALADRTHTLHLEITDTKTRLSERTERGNNGTGRHPVMP